MEYQSSLLSVGRRWSLEDVETELGSGEVHEELRVITVHDPPYMTINPQPDGSYNCSGYLYDLWETIAKELKVRFQMVPLLVGDYGTLYENGTWSGMVGDLAYGRADVAVTTLNMQSHRAAVVDYLDAYPVQTVVYKFFVLRERGEIPQLTMDLISALLKPLHVNVWWTLLASVLLLSVVLWISEGLGCTQAKNRKTSRDMTWTSCLLSCFMSFVGQGWSSTPGTFSGPSCDPLLLDVGHHHCHQLHCQFDLLPDRHRRDFSYHKPERVLRAARMEAGCNSWTCFHQRLESQQQPVRT